MSIIRVDGPARLYVGAMCCDKGSQSSSNAWYSAETWNPPASPSNSDVFKELGITENGVQISINNAMHRVNSDDCGGSEGMPAELIMMNTNALIRGVLTRYGESVTALAQAMSGLFGVTEGSVRLPGTPYFASNYGFSLLVLGFAARYYFPKCEMASQPREFNISSTERKTSFSIQAYPVFITSGSGTSQTHTGYLYEKWGNQQVLVPECSPTAYGGDKDISTTPAVNA